MGSFTTAKFESYNFLLDEKSPIIGTSKKTSVYITFCFKLFGSLKKHTPCFAVIP